jgi:hypothetical protein
MIDLPHTLDETGSEPLDLQDLRDILPTLGDGE